MSFDRRMLAVQACKLLRDTVDEGVNLFIPNEYYVLQNPFRIVLNFSRFQNVRIVNVRELSYTHPLRENLMLLPALEELYGCCFMSEIEKVVIPSFLPFSRTTS